MGKQIFFTMFVGLFLLLSCTESLEVDPIVNPPKKCTIEISNGPNVTVSQNVFSVVVGESVTFTATADAGYVIDILSINGIKVPLASGLATYTYSFVNVNYDTKISITSKKIPKYNVSVVTDKNVIASYIGSNTDIAPGGSLGINFKISEYYDVDTVLVDGVKASLANMSYSFSDINADHRIKVTSKINSLGIAFNFLTMSTKPFVMDSVLSRNIYKSEWNHNKSVPETVFFYTDQSRET